jgi:hypothetical protein
MTIFQDSLIPGIFSVAFCCDTFPVCKLLSGFYL